MVAINSLPEPHTFKDDIYTFRINSAAELYSDGKPMPTNMAKIPFEKSIDKKSWNILLTEVKYENPT